MHPDLDTQPPSGPFDRFPVIAYRLESGTEAEEWFFVLEFDLPNDILGPLTAPKQMTEAQARVRLRELGLNETEVDARIEWAGRWMATHIVEPGNRPVMWLPPL